MKNLVLVESPTKSKMLQRFLGEGYKVEASMGHVRDLPKSEFGVDVNRGFEPQYIIPADKRKKVGELKRTAADSDVLYLATDPDREGEAIAWHLAQLLPDSKIKRVVFHEITEEAIKAAFEHPRTIDTKLVDAQQARRVLDRLVGYKLSPLLWEKVKKGLSAGRVQSVTLRLIVEREKERGLFKVEEYWTVEAKLQGKSAKNEGERFIASVIEKDGEKLEIKNKEEAKRHVKNLEKAEYAVSKVIQKEVRRYPYPPFTTSTMQQGAANRLGMSAKKTMMLAQALYEHGLITYMRTDSVNLAPQAVAAARNYIENFLGKAFLPDAPRFYKSKSKNTQEAHEAIRVTDVSCQLPAVRLIPGMNKDHVRLYDLIWRRFVACQTGEAVLNQTTVDIKAFQSTPEESKPASGVYLLRVTGSVTQFEGWLKLYQKENSEEAKEQKLPQLSENKQLSLIQLLPAQHFTEPPPRYNEASLIKKLEELGIGRPSTYAPILSTIIDRFYVERIERKFVPTVLGIAVTDFLVNNFADIVDFHFTAQMEDELDEIARGEREWKPVLATFYEPFEKKLEEVKKKAQKVKMEVQYAGKKCPNCGKELIIRIGKFGKFLACSGFPECKHTESLEEKVNAKCPEDGGDIVIRKTKRGKTFYGCKNWPGCKFASWTKPKPSSLVIARNERSE